mgnify:CR=1 FL=1
METIAHINEGGTPTQKLIFFLEEFYGYNDESGFTHIPSKEEFNLPDFESKRDGLDCIIKTILNHEGMWDIEFYKIPNPALVLHIISIFENKFDYDQIYRIVFNVGKSDEVVFKEVAGTCGLNVVKIFKFLEEKK